MATKPTAAPPLCNSLDVYLDGVLLKDAAVRQRMLEEYEVGRAHQVQLVAKERAMAISQQLNNQYGAVLGGGMLGAGNLAQQAGATSPVRGYSPMEKLMTRLDVRQGGDMPFEYMYAHISNQENNVIVFVIKDGKPLTFTDEIPLFPSDNLIGKLNLLRG